MAFALNNTEEFLIKQEQILIPQMQKILTEKRRNATAKLYNSFTFDIEDKPANEGFIITMYYAPHGNFVLDGTRTYTKRGPSQEAITLIMKWIQNKGISIGGGKIRTPFNAKPKSAVKNPSDPLEKFAKAIWYSQYKNKRTWAGSTNFLKPWYDQYASDDFQDGLAHAIGLDLGNQIQVAFQDAEINIKM